MKAFFIVGVQRSGTTLLSVMLEKHPDVYMERKATAFRIITGFKNLYELLPFNLEHNRKEVVAWLVKNDINDRLAKLIDYKNIEQYDNLRALINGSIALKLQKNNKIIWGDKAPNLQHYLNDLMLVMPEVKIIHIIRDGRANAYSTSIRSSRNLALSAQQWVDGNVFGLVNQEILGVEQYKIIRYEDVLLNPGKKAREICSFLKIPYSEAMINLADDQLKQEESYVKSFFDQSKINKWKTQLTKEQIQEIETIQGPLLQQMAYELETPLEKLKFTPLSIKRQIWYNQLDNIKQLFNGKRQGMKNKKWVEYKVPFKNRVYSFARFLIRDLCSIEIFKALFSRFFYKDKYYKK